MCSLSRGSIKESLTLFSMCVPTRVIVPFSTSDRGEDKAKVDPISVGEMSCKHSESPDRNDSIVLGRFVTSQSSSRCADSSSSAICSSWVGYGGGNVVWVDDDDDIVGERWRGLVSLVSDWKGPSVSFCQDLGITSN